PLLAAPPTRPLRIYKAGVLGSRPPAQLRDLHAIPGAQRERKQAEGAGAHGLGGCGVALPGFSQARLCTERVGIDRGSPAMELSLESLGGLHGVAHAQAGELLSPSHARSAAAPHRGLVAPGRPGLAPGLGGTYTTLTPLQHLPPLAAVADKFHQHAAAAAVAGAHGGHPHSHPHPAAAPPPPPPPQRLAASVSGSFTLMRDERAALASVGHLYGPYGKELPAMGSPLSPLPNALPPALHGAPQPPPPPPPPPPLAAYGAPGHLAGDKLLPPAAFEPHAALLGRAEDALARGLPGGGGGGGSSSGAGSTGGLLAPLGGLAAAGAHGPHSGGSGPAAGGGGPGAGAAAEEINTKEVAQRITAELKRYSIPQAIFAQRILCRSQGTLSDLLRNPKPWSKLKSGRETFRRMWKWLQEPEFQRMSALRLAGRSAARTARP
ncbi:hypothetical protein EI555_003736, partial [Monodon monoceros]